MGGRSVREWKAAILQPEFETWIAFYNAHPFDDEHWFYRPAALTASAMHGADLGQLLQYLRHEPPTGYTEAELNTFKAFGISPPRKQ